jgi:hypothetical protein
MENEKKLYARVIHQAKSEFVTDVDSVSLYKCSLSGELQASSLSVQLSYKLLELKITVCSTFPC